MRRVVIVQGQPHLLEVVLALRPPGGLAGGLDGGEEQADQDGDDGDDHQQLDQREAAASEAMAHGRPLFPTVVPIR